jgi:hypothetical protein
MAVDFKVLQTRTSRTRVPLTQVKFGRGEREVTYESKDGKDVLRDPELVQAMKDFGVTDVNEAMARLPGGGSIEVDFVCTTAQSQTSGTYALSALIESALPLLSDLPLEQGVDLRQMVEDASPQGALFSADFAEARPAAGPDDA